MPRALVSLAVCIAAAVAAMHDASAVGFGRVHGAAVLGRPLDIAVTLHLEAGETIAPQCVAADVALGERRIARSAVRAQLEPGRGGAAAQLRVTTQTLIDEPVVNIKVTVGCDAPVSRSFVAFADRPGATAAAIVAAEPPGAAPPATHREPRAREVLIAAGPLPPRVAEPAPALAAAQAAASAAEASALAASQRVRALEAELERLRSESQAQSEALLQMRARGAERELGAALLPWLLSAVVLLAALTVWLALRTRRLAREAEPWSTSQLSAPAPDSGFDPRALPRVTTGNAVFEAKAAPASTRNPPPVDTAPAALQSTPPSIGTTDRRPVTVEEQIDLEQQADFYIVLGQDEAAIDLLLTYLRGTGGTSPMPYLKLLDIYRRTGDHEAYERTRIRFNQRFNGVAPAWGTDPNAGRTLDDYPDVTQRLERLWWSPLDAMAELESLLFRKGGDAELFDLPAYQEVLFLYQLARELHMKENQSERAPAKDVDVLLPIESDSTRSGFSVLHADVERSTVFRGSAQAPPLDIDLSKPS